MLAEGALDSGEQRDAGAIHHSSVGGGSLRRVACEESDAPALHHARGHEVAYLARALQLRDGHSGKLREDALHRIHGGLVLRKDDDRDVEWQVPGPEYPHEGLHLVPGVAGQHHDDEVPPHLRHLHGLRLQLHKGVVQGQALGDGRLRRLESTSEDAGAPREVTGQALHLPRRHPGAVLRPLLAHCRVRGRKRTLVTVLSRLPRHAHARHAPSAALLRNTAAWKSGHLEAARRPILINELEAARLLDPARGLVPVGPVHLALQDV
mmetsp:Transcript_64753/g.189893  ORF Transcript_64753/g.189893 Transcript_64753/m.189893 type:complete len:265 (+) Transcript_64753:1195-1989(+)